MASERISAVVLSLLVSCSALSPAHSAPATLGEHQAQPSLTLNNSTFNASRFLTQSTFGPTARGITQLSTRIQQQGERQALNQWIDQQQTLPPSYLSQYASNDVKQSLAEGWWKLTLPAQDQLRQRMGFTLSQILTISRMGGIRKDGTIADYYDMLLDHSFGNYRQLLSGVTRHIAMGLYLNLHNSRANHPSYSPNENYARELMQLFTIGTVMLNQDGSIQRDGNGHPIPAYTERDVETLSRALTGFNRFTAWFGPMAMRNQYHDMAAKVLFPGKPFSAYLAAGTAPLDDVEQALNAVFNHPNVAPFISRQLIQHFVTSNPTPAYIQRVSRVFNNNGYGERGDLGAVIKAVLLDDEARYGHITQADRFGKLKAPVLRFTNLWRSFPIQPNYRHMTANVGLIQKPLYAPSVFSFFQPTDSPAGEINQQGMVAPEFTLVDDFRLAKTNNTLYQNIYYSIRYDNADKQSRLLLNNELPLASHDLSRFLDRLNLLLMGGAMDNQMKNLLAKHLSTIATHDQGRERAAQALYLVMTSAQQAVQK